MAKTQIHNLVSAGSGELYSCTCGGWTDRRGDQWSKLQISFEHHVDKTWDTSDLTIAYAAQEAGLADADLDSLKKFLLFFGVS